MQPVVVGIVVTCGCVGAAGAAAGTMAPAAAAGAVPAAEAAAVPAAAAPARAPRAGRTCHGSLALGIQCTDRTRDWRENKMLLAVMGYYNAHRHERAKRESLSGRPAEPQRVVMGFAL
ncbi:hypothetical protein HYH02_002065 [Chlamydomonas schloesseri]|uniref:Uncharacterized protein n=1 Tax=Chlamydomonas schloesseri TaxID=2026947 RepID=A0A835WV88_9CHLO|nr:hypothetical protein HYH02_002065 [Chlamydomonas schloesseri]|eukprot:KAG2453858.1 hypothetical protein HYH02_002065 [Chlamydomonas schloesseri]